MPDNRNKMQGPQGDMDKSQKGGAHESPGRNPQGDQSASQQGVQDMDRKSSHSGDGGSYKEEGQNEQTRR